MKTLLATIIGGLLSALAVHFLTWQFIIAGPLLVSLIVNDKPLSSFLSGFGAIFLFWGWLILDADRINFHLLATVMGRVFHINDYRLFMFVNAAFGGVLGGLAGLSGALIRQR